MKEMIDRILAAYGGSVTVLGADGESRSARAFVQPVTSESWQNMKRVVQALGEIPVGQYVYIGPVAAPLTDTDLVLYREELYQVRRVDTLCVAGEALYIWGLLTKAGGADTWNS